MCRLTALYKIGIAFSNELQKHTETKSRIVVVEFNLEKKWMETVSNKNQVYQLISIIKLLAHWKCL